MLEKSFELCEYYEHQQRFWHHPSNVMSIMSIISDAGAIVRTLSYFVSVASASLKLTASQLRTRSAAPLKAERSYREIIIANVRDCEECDKMFTCRIKLRMH
ncbi:hypothetical protein PRIPAC_96136 [Pristionchus pacificus]|uniref:C2H2-type domain-containing protein n=1 Tax=Pristionchus pacificus TaxID=54126 RepID=A0A2A6BDM4_PRIPA|nr:hypothetical protein PRIPAC_96136 [Pristionchus pacificus]|eukprot:PDM63987.1 hypothetical protein PRIPAC_49488 [Pristionchus pacificus]